MDDEIKQEPVFTVKKAVTIKIMSFELIVIDNTVCKTAKAARIALAALLPEVFPERKRKAKSGPKVVKAK